MTKDIIRALFSDINIWRRGDERAPHKPLLLLYALAMTQKRVRWLPYSQVKEKLGELLVEFGPPRSTKTIDPFIRLETDGMWTFSTRQGLGFRESELIEYNVAGGFTEEIYEILYSDPYLIKNLAEDLLEEHFPETLHEDILCAVGLDLEIALSRRSARDPSFRVKVLQAYEYSCAICGFDVRLGNAPIALEAAHIKWHQFNGPDIESNGLALCSLHHKLFDRGAFAIRKHDKQYIVRVSQMAHGTSGFEEWLMKYHDKAIRRPQSVTYYPETDFVEWHVREVFKGTSRETSYI